MLLVIAALLKGPVWMLTIESSFTVMFLTLLQPPVVSGIGTALVNDTDGFLEVRCRSFKIVGILASFVSELQLISSGPSPSCPDFPSPSTQILSSPIRKISWMIRTPTDANERTI